MRVRLFPVLLALAAPLCAASVDQATARLEQKTAGLPAPMRLEYRMRAAQVLAAKHPDLSGKFVNLAAEEISAQKNGSYGMAILQGFAVAAPDRGVALLPGMAPSMAPAMITALVRAGRTDQALTLYRELLAKSDIQAGAAETVLAKLVKEKPAEARKLFSDMLAAAHFDTMEPVEAYRFLTAASAVAAIDAPLAAQACEQIAVAASAPNYGENAKPFFTATFAAGGNNFTTANPRETILIAAGSRLRNWNRERFDAHKALFEQWDLSAPVAIRGMSYRNSAAPATRTDVTDTASISKQMSQLRSLPTDADRARSVLQIVEMIRALPPDMRWSLAASLANLATEGDLGKEALTAVAETLAQGLRDSPPSTCVPYIQLASLVRFERLPAPKSDPALDAASALIDLEEELHQEAGFTLTALDGKTYTLAGLKGHVVLLNFWATWCPPCRKEMPDMEKLYQQFKSKGLIVLAVSDEDRDTVATFEGKQKYSFPILLDPDRKVNDAFNVEGIPKSFLFDRDGKLVAKAIDMRTEAQFLEMFKLAGLPTEP